MPESPFERRLKNRNVGHNGRVAEDTFAKRVGGRTRPGSGNMEGAKGDVTVDNFLIENKATQTDTMSLKREWLLKVYQEALELNRVPALAFQFTTEGGKSEKRDRWIAVPEHVFREMMEKE